jgi:hypothetical protein
MRTLIAVIITALVTAGSAFGAASWTKTSGGIMCKTDDGIIGCIPTSGRGYGVGISRDMVAIYNVNRSQMVSGCIRMQP